MKDLQGVFMNILSDQFGRYIVGVGSKGVFDFFGNQFQAGEHIKHKYNDWNDPITQLKNKSDWQGHDVNENNFLMNTLYENGMGVFLIRSQAPQTSVNDCNSVFKYKSCSPLMVSAL